MIKVHLPDLGENITKATISYWHIEEGETISEGDDLVEVATDKATFNVPAPCSGTLLEIIAHEGDEVHPGDILGAMEEDAAAADKAGSEEDL